MPWRVPSVAVQTGGVTMEATVEKGERLTML